MTHKCSESLGIGRKSNERVNATKVLSSRCIESREAYMYEHQGKDSIFKEILNSKIKIKNSNDTQMFGKPRKRQGKQRKSKRNESFVIAVHRVP